MGTQNFAEQKKIKRQDMIPRILQNNMCSMCCKHGKISIFNGFMLKFIFLSDESQEIDQ